MSDLSLQDKVTLGTAMLGATAGVAGGLVVLRGRSLVGDMLAHCALPGVCLAFVVLQTRSLFGLSVGALISGLIAVGLMTLIVRWTRTKQDAAIGILLSTFFGLGVVMLSRIQRSELGGGSSGLDSYIFGEPGNMLDSDLTLLAAVGAAVLVITGLLYKEFQLVAFDSDFAASQGWPAMRLDLAMMALVAVTTIVGLPIVGAILIAALVILPATTARMWTNRLHRVLLLAGVVGAAAGALGTRLSGDLPTGPVIVLAAAAMFAASLLFAPRRGVLARLWADARLRIRVAQDHLLRSLYELSEPRLPELVALDLELLREHRHWRPWMLNWLLRREESRGLLSLDGSQVALTPAGLRAAAGKVRTHRLWEMYMMHVGSAPDHVDRSADDVEHMLPADVVVEMEAKLAKEGRLPLAEPAIPASPHQIA